MNNELQKIWEQVLQSVKEEVSGPTFNSWFKDTECVNYEEGTLVVKIPTPFAKLWLENNYIDDVTRMLQELTSNQFKVKFVSEEEWEKETASEEENELNSKMKANELVISSLDFLRKLNEKAEEDDDEEDEYEDEIEDIEVDVDYSEEVHIRKAVEVLYRALDSDKEKVRVKAAYTILKFYNVID